MSLYQSRMRMNRSVRHIAGHHIPIDLKSFSSDGHRDTTASITYMQIQNLKVKQSFQKDILFLFRVRVCRLGILGRMTVSGSMLLSKINSSKSPNTAKPSNDLQQSDFLFIKHKRLNYGNCAIGAKKNQIY